MPEQSRMGDFKIKTNMKKYISVLILALAVFGVVSCSDSNDFGGEEGFNDPVNDFIWKGLNSWYNWQTESVNLNDSKDDIAEDYYSFLNDYTDYETLMLELCYKHSKIVGSASAVDRFSWFIEDYEVQNQSFQGIRTRFGFTRRTIEINESTGEVILSILIVEPGSPADAAKMQRGDIVYRIDGITLNTDNVNEVSTRLSNESVTLSFASEQDGSLIHIEDKTITRALVTSNPVHFKKVFDDIGGKKVGYLVYNQFSSSFNDELNAAFADFKAVGIDELVLDLRFNGGGSVLTSSYLASMINENARTRRFVNLVYNDKHSDENDGYNFANKLFRYDEDGKSQGQETINRLNTLSRLYILTSDGTASASELIINGLKPYMSSVKLIGATTYGKNVGSITLYDAPNDDYARESSANPAHKYAMQPIVFQSFNKNGESDYIQGFSPDIAIDESKYWNKLLPLGDRNESLLKAALDNISGIQSKESLSKIQVQAKQIKINLPENKFEQEMYIDHVLDEID